MGLSFADGFDSYSTSADLFRNWNGAGFSGTCYNATAGRTGGGAFQTVATSVTIVTPLAAFAVGPSNKLGVGFWLKMSATPSAQSTFNWAFFAATALPNGGMTITTGGFLRLVTNSGVTVLTGGTNVCDNAWHWIEFTFQANNSTPTQTCYVDSVLQWNATGSIGVTTTTAYAAVVTPATQTFTLDDIYFYDDTVAQSPKISDFPIGPRLITTLRPNGDDTVQFSRSAGSTNYTLVNEQSADDDTTYVQDATSGQQDLYTYGDLGFTPVSVSALQVVSRLKNPNPGTANFKNRCKSVSTVSDGTSTIIPSAYNNSRTFYNQDPATAAVWLPAAVDAAKFGLTVV